MVDRKSILIPAVIVSLVLIGSVVEASKPNLHQPTFYYRVEVSYSPQNPKWGELVTFTWKVTSDRDVENVRAGLYFRNAEIINLRDEGGKFYPYGLGSTLSMARCLLDSKNREAD